MPEETEGGGRGRGDRRREERTVVPGRRPVVELLRASRPVVRVLIAHGLKRSAVVAEIHRLARAGSIPISVVDRDQLDKLAAGTNHQGVVAETPRYRYTPLSDLLSRPNAALLFLDGVTDPHNLGSLLRSAEGAGMDGVVVPAHRSAGVTASVRRVSAGASEFIPTARVSSLPVALDHARSSGLWIVGLAGEAPEIMWDSKALERPLGLVLGSEERGMSSTVRAKCDVLVRIPQLGRLGSLNVSVAGALAMYEVARRDSATLRS
jgi:23S rRNA (guanosine2251-2'-O)-methyltransferase